ncbi:MAG: chemotaxis protein CheB [Thermodesulfobacteriota bacterium]
MENRENRFHIIALGASAGGLEAFEKFFGNLSSEPGMAFVLVPHLDPDHTSMMPELIQKFTSLPVHQIKDSMIVRQDNIYIVPPGNELGILNGELQLMPKISTAGPRMPIDYFFRALANDAGEYSAGIVLSGMGMDGSLGLRAIKGELGLTMAQDPKTAKYDSMPKNAIDTAQVDYVLTPEQMPAQLENYLKHLNKKNRAQKTSIDEKPPEDIQKIFFLLRQQTGHDFSAYKKNTIIRRIERRMNVHQIEALPDYVHHLQIDSQEVHELFRELLIGVTNFFRDPEAYESLKKHLSEVLREKSAGDAIRVWVPACSSGEEAYSIAMIIRECMEDMENHFNIQIFATDIDERAIEKAREGGYPPSIEADVGAERIKKFFISEESLFRIRPDIREMLVFAKQDLIKDPPFTKLDLISCRNLLIYMETPLQKKLVPLFNYSLKPGGILFLGGSESIGEFSDLMEPLDRKWKIFKQKKGSSAAHHNLEFPLTPRASWGVREEPEPRTEGEAAEPAAAGVTRMAEKALMANWIPPSVIVNDRGDILYIHGRTGKYLEPSPGQARLNLFDMAREGLRIQLQAAIRKAANQNQPVYYRSLRVKVNGDMEYVNLTVRPLDSKRLPHNLVMVSFEEAKPLQAEKQETQQSLETDQTYEQRVRELEQELEQTKESLQSTIEELETSNEELKSTNEEFQSTNEELHSTNEELETAREEQQSLNEELTTVNAELQEKIDELTRANSDMKNLLDSIDTPIIFLDNVLRVKRFTSQIPRVINLIDSDIGRPVSDLSVKLEDVSLKETAAAVIKDLVYREMEVRTTEGNWFFMRVAPYRTQENIIDGVVISFTDITRIKKSQAEAERLATVLKDANDAVIIWDLDGRIRTWNRGAGEMYGYSEEEAMAMNIRDLTPKERKAETEQFIEDIKKGNEIRSFQTQRQDKYGNIIDVWTTVTRIPDLAGTVKEILTTERDLKWLQQEPKSAE